MLRVLRVVGAGLVVVRQDGVMGAHVEVLGECLIVGAGLVMVRQQGVVGAHVEVGRQAGVMGAGLVMAGEEGIVGARFKVLGQQRIVGLRGIVVAVSRGYRLPDDNTRHQRRHQEYQSQPF